MVAVLIISASACKKDETTVDGSASTSIVGKWNLSELGTDANKNNVLDAGETTSVTGAGVSGYTDLKSDKTFSSSLTIGTVVFTASGTYTYANNSITTVSSSETKSRTVNTLTTNKLVVKDAEDAQWEVYTK